MQLMGSAAAQPSGAHDGRDGDPKAGDRTRPLILIVDDSADTREMYSEVFRDSGLRVVLAANGEDAVGTVSAVKPDLVIMDLAMPVLDGWEATRRIKAQPDTRHIRVIAL